MALNINLLKKAQAFADNIEEADEDIVINKPKSSELISIPIDNLVDFVDENGEPQPFNVEKKSRKYAELRKSIHKNGQITPITVREINDGMYEIIAGHCRVSVMRDLKILTAKAIVVDYYNEKAYDIMVDSNIQRDKPTPLELARVFKHYLNSRKDSDSLTIANDIAEKFDISKKQMYRYAKVLNFNTAIRMKFDEGAISISDCELLYNLLVRPADMSELDEDRELSEHQQNVLAEYLNLECCKLKHKCIDYLQQLIDYKPRYSLNDLDEYVFSSDRKSVPNTTDSEESVTEESADSNITKSENPFFKKLRSSYPQHFNLLSDSDIENKILELLENM